MDGNENKTRRQLDSIRSKRRKFICINDNNNSQQLSRAHYRLIKDFFLAMWPLPSPFEYQDGYRNEYLRYGRKYTQTSDIISTDIYILYRAYILYILALYIFIGYIISCAVTSTHQGVGHVQHLVFAISLMPYI